MILVD